MAFSSALSNLSGWCLLAHSLNSAVICSVYIGIPKMVTAPTCLPDQNLASKTTIHICTSLLRHIPCMQCNHPGSLSCHVTGQTLMVHETTNLAKWIHHNNAPILINLGGFSKRGGGIFWSCQKIHPPHSITLTLFSDSTMPLLSRICLCNNST